MCVHVAENVNLLIRRKLQGIFFLLCSNSFIISMRMKCVWVDSLVWLGDLMVRVSDPTIARSLV